MPPVYDYRCERKSCGHEFECFFKTQSAVEKEEPQEECPKCGSKKKKRMIAKKTSHIFKSGRWFKEGY